MRKVYFVNRYFYPDLSATSQILTDLARHLAQAGESVAVVTSRQSYENPAAALAPRETVFGVEVARLATTRFGRANLIGRALDYSSFYVSVFWFLLANVGRNDIVVAKTDPPLVSVVVALVTRIKGARLVNWLQDIFPEAGAALGVRILGGLPGRVIRFVRDVSLRAAVANIALGERMADYVRGRKVDAERVHVIPNWADDHAIVPLAHEQNALRREWFSDDMFVVAYSGNLGRAHDVSTMLDAAVMLRDDARIKFAFLGGGARIAGARRFVDAKRLENVGFLPYQPREQLSQSLGAADLHLVSLRAELEGLIVPSKFYGIAAAGRPMVFVGDPDGEIGRLIGRFDCGITCKSGDSGQLSRFILSLADNPQIAGQLGSNARHALERHFSQDKALRLWSELLVKLHEGPV